MAQDREPSISESIDARIARAEYMCGKYYDHIKRCARDQQAAERSDPFVYNRVMSHYLGGLCTHIDDYMVAFSSESRLTATGSPYSVEVAHSQKRP